MAQARAAQEPRQGDQLGFEWRSSVPILSRSHLLQLERDRWFLLQDAATGRDLVRHEANLASGGHVTEVTIEEFLPAGGSGPEHDALRRLTRLVNEAN